MYFLVPKVKNHGTVLFGSKQNKIPTVNQIQEHSVQETPMIFWDKRGLDNSISLALPFAIYTLPHRLGAAPLHIYHSIWSSPDIPTISHCLSLSPFPSLLRSLLLLGFPECTQNLQQFLLFTSYHSSFYLDKGLFIHHMFILVLLDKLLHSHIKITFLCAFLVSEFKEGASL